MLHQVRIDEERGQEHVLETCCCGCCTVKQGTRILGILSIICSLLNILDAMFEDGISAGAQARLKDHQGSECDYVSRVVVCVWASITLVLAKFLLRGIATENADFVRPYLSWLNFELVMSALAMLIIAAGIFIKGLASQGLFVTLIILAIFGGLAWMLLFLQWYFLNVVKRYVGELELGNNLRPRDYQPVQ